MGREVEVTTGLLQKTLPNNMNCFNAFGSIRLLSATAGAFQRPSHVLYPSVDWAKVAQGNFAIVDPVDEHAILYLSDKAYQIQVRVSLSTDTGLVVLARPFDTKVDPDAAKAAASQPVVPAPNVSSSEKSDAKKEANPFSQKTPQSKKAWKRLLQWHISRFASLKDSSGKDRRDPLVTLTAEKLLALIVLWAEDAYFRSGGHLSTPKHVRAGFETLARRLQALLRNNGVQHTIVYMKNTLFYLNKYLAGTGAVDRSPFSLNLTGVSLQKNGCPRIIPSGLRSGLGNRDLRIIRTLETVFRSYTAFKGEYALDDLASIRSPHPPIGGPGGMNSDTLLEFREWCENTFWPKVVKEHAGASWAHLSEPSFAYPENARPYLPMTASPQSPVSLLGAPQSALLWAECGLKYEPSLPRANHLRKWLEHVEESRTLDLFNKVLAISSQDNPRLSMFGKEGSPLEARTPYLGRLAVLEEPAGKLRTVAMVDYWTQRALKPMHDWLMDVLEVLPSDCTFDQDAGVESYVRWLKAGGKETSWSIDLKSATDLIPIELYRAVLGGLLPQATVDLWIDLLRDRGYALPQPSITRTKSGQRLNWEAYHLTKEVAGLRFVRYERGQPMGALTSWPSMALVHHALVLFSAHKCGRDPYLFSGYRVLGDDLVIGEGEVSTSYLSTTSDLQVPTSQSKTLTGKVLIFASQVYLGYENISPLSLNEELSIATAGQRLECALRAVKRGWTDWKDRSVASFLRLLVGKPTYRRFLIERKKGLLGTVAQVALISALALGGKVLDLLGVRMSRRSPILNILMNSVRALTRDQDPPGSVGSSRISISEFERWLAIAHVRKLYDRVVREARSYDTSFTNLIQMFSGVGSIGSFDDPRTNARRASITAFEGLQALKLQKLFPGRTLGDTTGLSSEETKVYWETLQARPPYIPRLEQDDIWDPRYHRGIAEIVKDHFVVTTMISSQTVPKTHADYLARPESRATVKVVDVAVPLHRISDWRWPRDDALLLSTLKEDLVKGLHFLTHSDDPSLEGRYGGPWELVDSLVASLARVPRLPAFEGFPSLKPDRSPREIDLNREWRRRIDIHLAVLGQTHFGFKFTVDFTTATSMEQIPDPYWDTLRDALTRESKSKPKKPN